MWECDWDKSMPICIWSRSNSDWVHADPFWVKWVIDFYAKFSKVIGDVDETILALILAGF